MAYVDRQSGTSRATSIATVGLIHAAIGAALIYGFAPDIGRIINEGPLKVINVPVDPPPPPPTDKVEETKQNEGFVPPPRPEIDVIPARPEILVTEIPLPTIPTDFTGRPPMEVGPTRPAFQPKSPAPANEISRWATTNDYPSISLKREEQGISRFRVVVGTDGKVKSCEITASSGSTQLDNTTCNLVTRRAKFQPATNESGERIVGTYSNAVRWQLPN
jgi:protein TonB